MQQSSAERHEKITEAHIGRTAYIYVRQSSQYQVENHLQSQRRQYDLAKTAEELGWVPERIVVVDEDQGKSGAAAHTRTGFARVVTAVGRSEVGIVMSLEASRLARNSPDWHNLIYMCRYTNTLIADEHGIYDLALGTDRMILGIRGQMSEMELDTSIHRMVEGRWSKARRGEYLIHPPAGYEVDDLEQVVITSDEAVTNAVRLVFAKFDEIQSVRGVFNWWRDEGMKFPVRRLELRSKPVVWVEPAYRHFITLMHNPIYTGAYAFGRTQRVRQLDPKDPRKVIARSKKREDYKVLIKDHHPGFISWEKFEANLKTIKGNQQISGADNTTGHGPAREGEAWLQGLVRCGLCGRGMGVSYGGNRHSAKTKRTMQYRCFVARRYYEGRDCQVVSGRRINEAVMAAFVEVTKTAGVEAAALAERILNDENADAERAWAAQIEKAEFEAQRAERQFHAVEPENRTVARTLETRWNASLEELDKLKAKAQQSRVHRSPLSELELARARRLGADLELVWHASTTAHRERKQLLRAAIEEVQLRSEEREYAIKIVWKGGATTERRVPRARRGDKGINGSATPTDTIDIIRKLAVEFDDRQIACILNKQNRQTGEGNPFTANRVATHRHRNGIEICTTKTPRDPREGPFTADEAAVQLGVAGVTIHRWLREGILPGKQATAGAPWRIVLTEELRQRLVDGGAPPGWLGLTEAAKRLGISKQLVAHMVKTAKLNAVRVVIAGRSCWKIDVASATSGRQADLFDQMTTVVSGEA